MEGKELCTLPVEAITGVTAADEEKADRLLAGAMEGFSKKIVVLDDDPTGVQTVHDVSVYTDWEVDTLRQAFAEEDAMFFVLTNSRSFSAERTERVHREIAGNVSRAAAEAGRDFMIVSRGDSTLRGHFPLETRVLADTLEQETGIAVDGEVICPFFPEGGRYTLDNVHYVREGDTLVPAGMTEFARDKTFGYRSSDLCAYVEEKTAGEYKAEDCICIGLAELRAQDTEGILRKLLGAKNRDKIIVNAVCYADLKVFCAALVSAMEQGRHFLARSAAALPKVLGRVSDQPLLQKEQLVGSETNGGIVLIGSHVKKTTDQLNALRAIRGKIQFMEFRVSTFFEENGLQREAERMVKRAEAAILQGDTAVIYTSRELLAPQGLSPEEQLQMSTAISEALTGIVGGLTVRPGFLIAKGGITSSDVGTKALMVRKARVMGQVRKGIPVWMTGSESRFPGMPYIIFPGNVGEANTLREIVEELR